MARLPRYVIPGQPQHIIQRGNNRQAIFAADADYQFFRDALVEAASQYGLQIHAYVWMTNHIHLLATPQFENSISKVFQSVGRKYVQYFNYVYKRSGTLWEGRYRATVVDSEQYLIKAMRYIELNPVRAHIVQLPADYPWSSYAYNAYGASSLDLDWLQPHPEYIGLGRDAAERQAAYQDLFKVEIASDDLEKIRDCTHKGWALGGAKFQERLKQLCQRPTSSKGVGRPKREINRV